MPGLGDLRQGIMNQYEGLFLVKSNLDEKANNAIFEQIKEAITKNAGKIISSRVWAQNRNLSFPIKKSTQGTYYLVNFDLDSTGIDKIKQIYRLNENILRVLLTKSESS